jgi:hypothetical protein
MKPTAIEISQDDFDKNLQKAVFYDNSFDRRFRKVCLANVCFYFAWRSDIVEPLISEIDTGIWAIAIDQNFAIVDFIKDEVLCKLALDYNFYTVKIINGKILIATELEILEMNKRNFKVEGTFALPDFFQEFYVETNLEIRARCVNGESVRII